MLTVYVDGKAAWLTVAGGFVANFLLGGLAKSYGLVMEAFQEEFQSGSAYLLLAGGLIYTLMYCLSLVNHYLSLRYGSRPIVLFGALGSCISLLVAAYSPSIALWVVAIGFGVGTSLSCIYFTVFSVVGQCFRRYLGLANGISVAGVSVGQMAFPSLIIYLNHTYGTRGGTVVMSAVCLHLLITAALMPRHIIDPDAPPPAIKIVEVDSSHRRRCRAGRRRKRYAKTELNAQDRETVELTANSTVTSLDTVNVPAASDKASMLLELDEKVSTNAMGDAPLGKSTSQKAINENETTEDSFLSYETTLAKHLSRSLLAVYILAKIFGDIGDVSVSFIAPAHGTKLGLDGVTISRAIAVAGAVDLVSRLGVGWLTDRPGCVGRRGLVLAITWLVEGLNALAFSELDRLKSLEGQEIRTTLLIGYFFCFGLHGVCSGTAMTQMVVVLCDWVGPSRLSHSLALTMLVLGLLISPGQFAIGYLSDVTNDYVWPMRLCFCILIMAGMILLLEFPVRWFHARSARHHYHTVLSANPHLMHNDKSESYGIGYPRTGDCWQVVDSDSAEQDLDNGGCEVNEKGLTLNHTEAQLLQTGITPVPAHLPLVDGRTTGGLQPSPLFVCAQQRSDEWNDLEGV